MAKTPKQTDPWRVFQADCAKSARRAENRASNLQVFAWLIMGFGVLATIGTAVYLFQNRNMSDASRYATGGAILPVFLGSLLIGTLLAGFSSLVDLTAKRLRIKLFEIATSIETAEHTE